MDNSTLSPNGPRTQSTTTAIMGDTSDPLINEQIIPRDFNAITHVCQGFEPAPYFHGRAGTPNDEFLLDLETDSMEKWALI